jgi:hypothetical protein
MVHVGRAVLVTIGLAGAGILFGAIAGGTAFTFVVLVAGARVSFEAFEIGAFFGAPLGAVTAPLLSWLLLRRVPLGQMFLVCSFGTIVGAIAGWFTAAPNEEAVDWALVGAFLGSVVAATTLWYRARARSGSTAPNLS